MSALGQRPTDVQLVKMQERKNALQRKIDNWCSVQIRYIPGILTLRGDTPSKGEYQPQNVPLWLPSAIGRKIPCNQRFYSFEWDLRVAHANEALEDLRKNLQLRSHFFKHKDRFVTGQRANTRANATISRVQRYINANVAQYCAARIALLHLAPQLSKDDTWKISLPELHDGDVRHMAVGVDGESEGRRTLSWIWKNGNLTNDNDKLHECTHHI
jgi:hypothetical protein